MICFACGEEIDSYYAECPYCKYKFTDDGDYSCPNSDEGICLITENYCNMGSDYNFCEIKQEIEKNSF